MARDSIYSSIRWRLAKYLNLAELDLLFSLIMRRSILERLSWERAEPSSLTELCYDHGDILQWGDVNKMVSKTGERFVGNHPISQAIRHLRSASGEAEPYSKAVRENTAPVPSPIPWSKSKKIKKSNNVLHDDDYLRFEVNRLERLKKSLMKRGYLYDHRNLNSTPRFQILIGEGTELVDKDFRIVVTGGQHRVLSLIELGWGLIPMRPSTTLPRSICRTEFGEWPQVRSGEMSGKDALERFDSYFRQ